MRDPNKSQYKGFYISAEGHSTVYVYDRAGKVYAKARSVKDAKRFIDGFTEGKIKLNPAAYTHERIAAPRTLARRGKVKYRSVRTPGGSLLRIAFPRGRRKKGSGELQAILHKNPGMEVANEIYRQLGGKRFSVFTGARQFVGGADYLQFSIPLMRGINKVKIILAGDDTYTLEFYRIRGTSAKLAETVSGIYADQLADAFTSKTGLYTSFASNPAGKLAPFHSGLRPGYQNINRRFLRSLGLSNEKIDRIIARQLNGATLADAYYAELPEEAKLSFSRRGINPPVRMDSEIARAAAADVAERRRRAAGRPKWTRGDYNAAVREFFRLYPEKSNPARYGKRSLCSLDYFLADHPDIAIRALEGGRIQLFPRNLSNYDMWLIHHLSDYRIISSASGPSYIMVPIAANPLTRTETRRVRAEARLHARMGLTPGKRAYYKGVAEGMRDTAAQYGRNPTVYRSAARGGRTIKVKNLGWLLKNWREAGYFNVHPPAYGRPAYLMATMKDATIFATDFASLWVLHKWLDRPVFRGLNVTWTDLKTYEIGSPEYRAIPVSMANPRTRENETPIYGQVTRIEAVKGPGHKCDAACKRAGHAYYHDFNPRKKAGIFGVPDGSLTVH